jgi:hypothetical protein
VSAMTDAAAPAETGAAAPVKEKRLNDKVDSLSSIAGLLAVDGA